MIAEFKRRSPSAGELREHADAAELTGAYERGGACAVSVLTEGAHFAGSLEDLRAARARTSLPILRKDFIVDDYQLQEARVAGADAVLLIVAALERSRARRAEAVRGGDRARDGSSRCTIRDELERALIAGAEIVGINNRDLRDFSVDVTRTARLLGSVPAGVRVVSESGISDRATIARLDSEGLDGVLVGEALMRSPDPEAKLKELLTPDPAPASTSTPSRGAGSD